jgi:hypothetical protein
MAPIPTPRETALKILAIFFTSVEFRSGKVLSSHEITGVWNRLGLHHADLKPGLDYAEGQGWIEIFDSENSFCLTETGFAQVEERH